MSGSLQRLQEVGLVPAELSDDIASVLDDLSGEEVEVLLGVAAKLGGDGDVEGFGMPGLASPGFDISLNPIMKPGLPTRGISPIGAADGGNSGGFFF